MPSNNALAGLVTLLEANRPTVTTDDGREYLCYMRGRLKREVGRILVGDRVLVLPSGEGEATVLDVLARQNQLWRPPVANVAGMFAVFSLSAPAGNLELLDKRLVMAHLIGCEAEVVITKADLPVDKNRVETVVQGYQAAGYRVWRVSAATGQGIAEWITRERRGIWVLTGESGVGKSSLLARVLPAASVVTGDLGRGGRGQQTTRWVRLYPVEKFWLADTPGYTALNTRVDDARTILEAFGEWREIACRFSDCLHRGEPGCKVVELVESGRLAPWRYRHYRLLLDEWVAKY